MTSSVTRIGIGLLAAALLLGCGQKGSLYLPSQKKSKVPPTSTAAPPGSTAPVSAPADSGATPAPSGAH